MTNKKVNKTEDIVQYRKDYYNKIKSEISDKVKCDICDKEIQKRSLYNHNKKFHTIVTQAEVIDKITQLAKDNNLSVNISFDLE